MMNVSEASIIEAFTRVAASRLGTKMLTYKYNDDGYYQIGYRIYDEGDRFFCDTHTEEAAIEIVNAVNALRIVEVERKLDGK